MNDAIPSASNAAAKASLPPEYSSLKRPKPSPSLKATAWDLLHGLILTIFSCFFLANALEKIDEYRLLSHEGESVQATITRLNQDDSGESTSYSVDYQFTAVVNGHAAKFPGSGEVSVSLYSNLKVKQEIEIIYAVSNPTHSAIKAEFGLKNSLLPTVFAGGFVMFGLLLIYTGIKALRYLRRLNLEGYQSQAILFDLWQDKDSEGNKMYLVAYAFEALSPTGQQIITLAEQNKKVYDKHQVGDRFIVRYLPNNPQVCQIIDQR